MEYATRIENKVANRKCKNDRTIFLPISMLIQKIVVHCINTENDHFMN